MRMNTATRKTSSDCNKKIPRNKPFLHGLQTAKFTKLISVSVVVREVLSHESGVSAPDGLVGEEQRPRGGREGREGVGREGE